MIETKSEYLQRMAPCMLELLREIIKVYYPDPKASANRWALNRAKGVIDGYESIEDGGEKDENSNL